MADRWKPDVIVIGAGSAGSAAAGLLARDPTCNVLIVEAGGKDWNPLLRVPLMTGVLLRGRYANWFYHTDPEPNLNQRRLFWPRGKVLGGSSAINGMVWTRGVAEDYDGWAQHGLPEWGWDKVLPAYRAIESCSHLDRISHGQNGPQPISRLSALHPLSRAFLDAGQQAGHALSPDFNGPLAEGVGQYDFTISEGRRVSAWRAFVHPVLDRPNVRVVTGAHVTRLIIEGGRAVGVELAQGTERVRYDAGSEIVLSAGTVNSPQILMLSGIGPAAHLHELGIPVIADLPGVGQNLQDHLLIRVEHFCREPITMFNLLRMDRAAVALAKALATGTGPAARFPLEVGAFLRSDPTRDMTDLQAHFLPALSTAALRLPFSKTNAVSGHGYLSNIYQLRPESRGAIALRSTDPFDSPHIRPNYLSAPRDMDVLRQGVKLLREIFAQPAFAPFRGEEKAPGAHVRTDAEIDAWIRQTADTVFHPVGTCRMGNDRMAVVDQHLKVRGIEGLRIADASVMPLMTGSNTHAPSVMIGARAAGFIMKSDISSILAKGTVDAVA
jgi:choline dehydrogenase